MQTTNSHIRWLQLAKCESMKNVDATVFPSIEHLGLDSLPELQEICDGPISSTSFQNLKELELKSLWALTQFWKSSSVCENNYVPHFTNLSTIDIWKCDSLRNLGQLSMAGKDCLPQLEELSIRGCSMMEQVFLWNDEEAGENKNSIESQRKRHVMTKLKKVVLENLPNLTIFYQGIQSIEFPLLREMKIHKCPKMKSIIGSSSADNDDDGCLHLLCQPQKISFGSSSIKVLEINHNPFCGHEIPSSFFNGLEKLIINEYEGSMSLFKLSIAANLVSLTELHIANCDRLRNIGQLSMAGKDCLSQLQKLIIMRCEMMEHVFLWNDEEAGDENSIESQQKRHVITKLFPKLKDVQLQNLPNLTSFCQGIQGIEFPLLKEMKIEECPKMKSIIRSSSADIDDDGYLHLLCQPQKVSFGSSLEVSTINHNPFCGHEIHSSLFNGLDELTINKYESSMSLFTFSMAANLVNLRKLSIANCDEMIKVIEDEQQVASACKKILLFHKLEILRLKKIPKLVTFCDWKCEVELPSLRKVEIERCPNMENLRLGLVATPNLEAFTTDLTTYVGVGVDDAFNSLKELVIRENENPLYDHKISASLFNGLEKLRFTDYKGSMSLFSSSAVGNLVNLKVLYIYNSDEILVKVIEDEEEKEDGKVVSGAQIRTLVFPKLEKLRLYYLPKLVRFCKWNVELPSLTKVKIRSCPNMEKFSMGFVVAPNLKIVEIDEEEIDATKDLNGVLQQHYHLARRKKEINGDEESSEEKDEIKEEEDDQN